MKRIIYCSYGCGKTKETDDENDYVLKAWGCAESIEKDYHNFIDRNKAWLRPNETS